MFQVPACFQQYYLAIDIGVEIGQWILQRIPNPSLCGQMHNTVDIIVRLEDLIERVAVGNIGKVKLEG